jgi:integrase
MSIYPDKGRDGKLTGRFRVEVTVDGQKARGRYETLKEAEQAQRDFKASFASGKPPQGANIRKDDKGVPRTLRALSRKSEGSLWRGKAIERTNFQKLIIIANLLGDLQLKDITTSQIDELAKLLIQRGVKPNTLNRYYSCLNTLLKWGKQRSYVADLPSFPWQEEEEGRIREITEAEEYRLCAFMASYGRQDIADLITVAIRTGLRRGELLRVKLAHIERGQVSIWITKNKKARTIPLDDETERLLRTLVLAGMPTIHALRHSWDKAKQDMGLADDDDFVFHACRHTCCTRLIRADINAMVVKKWMGHKRIETTLRYTHLNDGDLKAALEKLQVRQGSSTVVDFRQNKAAS